MTKPIHAPKTRREWAASRAGLLPNASEGAATAVWDFINRSMPPKAEGTLSANEVYALTAFLLFQNGIIRENDVLDAKSLPQVQMPNRDGFLPAKPEWKPRTPRPFGFYP